MRLAFILFSLAIISLACKTSSEDLLHELRDENVWVHLDSQWREAPPEAEIREATAWAKLARFRSGGKFVLINCLLIKQGDAVRVSQGDPVVVYRGHWAGTGSGGKVEYAESFRTVPVVGAKPSQMVDRIIMRNHRLFFLHRIFGIMNDLELRTFESAISQGN